MTNRTMLAVTGWVVVLTTLVAGCQMNMRARTVRLDGEAMPAGAPLAVDVENRAGTVTLRVDPKLKQPRVEAQPADGRSMKKDKPWAAAELARQDDRWVLRVIGGGNETTDKASPIILTITVPSCEGVRVKNAGGPVTLRDVGGAISVANTATGAPTAGIELRTQRALTAPVTLTSTGGDISCKCGKGSKGQLTITSQSGDVQTQSNSTKFTGGKNLPKGWTGVLGSADNTITISTDHGDAVFEAE